MGLDPAVLLQPKVKKTVGLMPCSALKIRLVCKQMAELVLLEPKHKILETHLSFQGFQARIKHLGAELASFTDPENRQWMWQAGPEWPKHAPVLFPIVGTLKDNRYRIGTNEYVLPRHGFARERLFECVEQAESRAVFQLRDDADSRLKYPFAFQLQLTYALHRSGLTISYQVRNLSETEMPFALGAHPAFALPCPFDSYALEFPADASLDFYPLVSDLLSEQPQNLALQNHQLPLSEQLFEKDALVFKHLESKSVTLIEKGSAVLEVAFSGFPSLGIWTKPGAAFLCIEPWSGYADTVSATGNILQKEAIRILQPGGNFETNFSINVL